MTLNEDINAKLDRVETLSGEIAGDLDEVIEKLNNAPADGLTKEEAEAIAARLEGHVVSLEGIAGKVPEPPAEG